MKGSAQKRSLGGKIFWKLEKEVDRLFSNL